MHQTGIGIVERQRDETGEIRSMSASGKNSRALDDLEAALQCCREVAEVEYAVAHETHPRISVEGAEHHRHARVWSLQGRGLPAASRVRDRQERRRALHAA